MTPRQETPSIVASNKKEELFQMSCKTVWRGIEKGTFGIKIASGYLRFLESLLDVNQKLSAEQEEVKKFLMSDKKSPVVIQVLLYYPPDKNNKIVRQLIKKGAIVRYLYKKDEAFRMVLVDDEIHLSISDNKDNPVVHGFNCTGDEAKQLVDYFYRRFDEEFDKATELILEEDEIKLFNGHGQKLK